MAAEREQASIQWIAVSTHSHPKVAATFGRHVYAVGGSFNTQPPEGGCGDKSFRELKAKGFNTQPPEGGCLIKVC